MIQNKMCILWNLFELVSLSWNFEIGYIYEKIPTKKSVGIVQGCVLMLCIAVINIMSKQLRE